MNLFTTCGRDYSDQGNGERKMKNRTNSRDISPYYLYIMFPSYIKYGSVTYDYTLTDDLYYYTLCTRTRVFI